MIRASKKVVSGLNDRWLKIGIGIAQFVFPLLAFADGGLDDPTGGTDIGAVASKATGEVSSVETFLWGFTKVAGIAIAMSGLMLWHKISNEKSQKPRSAAIITIAVGAGLFFLHTVIELFGNSTLTS
jgi:hypothetical protein